MFSEMLPESQVLKKFKKGWNQWALGISTLSLGTSALPCSLTSRTLSHWSEEGQQMFGLQLHGILYSLSCWPRILFPAKYWNSEDTVINIILTPLCCLSQMHCCAPEAVMNLFSPHHCKISVCLSVYLFTWVPLQMGKLRLENSTCRL